MKKITLLLLSFCTLLHCSAQYNTGNNKVWTFGLNAGIDFNSGTAVPMTSTSISSSEAAASICDAEGCLLFYTDGNTVYNRLGLVMPAGAAIVPFMTMSATQGALIMPFINDPGKYYLFSTEERETGGGQMAYCVVDMTLDGGLGDVVAGSAGTMIASGMSEKMIIIPGNSCNAWLMTHKKDLHDFYAYEITASGLSSTPVISSLGTYTGFNSYSAGAMKCSHDRAKIAVISTPTTTDFALELYDFDVATGMVSNCRLLDVSLRHFSVEFSPDNKKLYGHRFPVYQWDVSLSTTTDIIASKTAVSPSVAWASDFRLGPDGKIYFAKASGGSTVGRINFPNAAAAACGYEETAVVFTPASSMACLPNLVWNTRLIDGPASVCAGGTATLISSVAGGTWSTSDPAVASVSTGGVVTGISPGTAIITHTVGVSCSAAMTVTVVASPSLTGVALCIDNAAALTVGTGAGTWVSSSPGIAAVGAGTGIVHGIAAGTARITYNRPGCPEVSTVVTVGPLSVTGSGYLCTGSSLTLSASPSGGVWSSASGITTVSSSGVVTGVSPGIATISYSLGPGCIDTSNVTVVPLPVITGGSSICLPGSLALTCGVPGGTWASSAPGIAAIGLSTGVISGTTPGTSVITYTTPLGCTSTSVISLGYPPAFEGGAVCVGGTLTLMVGMAGGTWSGSAPTFATVESWSGIITGVAAPGTTLVTYTLFPGCSGTAIVYTFMQAPKDSTRLCVGSSETFTGTVAGGTWNSGNPAIASVGLTSGSVSAVAEGTALVTYIKSAHCHETVIVTVTVAPAAIAGPAIVAAGASITLSDPTSGGTWSSADPAIATVNSSGEVIGITPGTATIYYTLSSGCSVSVVITVIGAVSVLNKGAAATPSIYPNPASDEIIIKVIQSYYSSFAIYNALGQLVGVHRITGPEMKVSVKALPAGKYKVVFNWGKANEVIQFVKL